jgi:hypothetical protein
MNNNLEGSYHGIIYAFPSICLKELRKDNKNLRIIAAVLVEIQTDTS